MYIQDYYKKIGSQSLAISLYFTFVATIVAILFIYINQDAYVVSIFLYLSFLYYFGSVYYVRKSIRILPRVSQIKTEQNAGCYLLKRDRHVHYFFSPTGIAKYVAYRKKNRNGWELQLFLNNEQRLSTKLERINGSFLIKNIEHSISGKVQMNGKFGYLSIGDEQITLLQIHPYEWEIRINHRIFAQMKIGWLPLTYTSLFSLNTPFIRFYERSTKEKLMEGTLLLFSLLDDLK